MSVMLNLNNLPACLRDLADRIEAGSTEEIATLLVLTEDTSGELVSRCYGHNPTRHHVAGMFLDAAQRTNAGRWR